MDELDNIIPVRPPIVNKKIKPKAQRDEGDRVMYDPWRVPSQLKILIPVGTAMIIVAAVK